MIDPILTRESIWYLSSYAEDLRFWIDSSSFKDTLADPDQVNYYTSGTPSFTKEGQAESYKAQLDMLIDKLTEELDA